MEHTVRTRKYGLRRATIKNKLRHGRRLDTCALYSVLR